MPSKQLSGSAKRKKLNEREKLEKSLKGGILKFTKKIKVSSGASEDIVEENVFQDTENIQDNVNAEDNMENVYTFVSEDVVDYNQPFGP